MKKTPDIVVPKLKPAVGLVEEPNDISVCVGHPLWLSRAAGRVDQVSDMIRQEWMETFGRINVVCRTGLPSLRLVKPNGMLWDLYIVRQASQADEHPCSAIAQDVVQPGGRVAFIHRHISSTRLENAQHCNDCLRGAIQQDRNKVIGTDTQ